MHVSLTKRLVGSRRDLRVTPSGPRNGALAIAALLANFLESFDEALVPMDDDVEQSTGAPLR